jgi:TIR domain/Septum formation
MAQAFGRAPGEASGPDEDGPRIRGQLAYDVFVSYSGRNKRIADAIVSRLEQAGVRCWVAPRDAIPGEFFGKSIMEAIETSSLMVVVLSEESVRSPHVVREVGCAVKNHVVIIPFRIETVEPTGAMAYYLSGEHWLDAMPPPPDSHIVNLVKVVHRFLESDLREPPPLSSPLPSPRHRLIVGLIVAASLAILGAVLALFLVSSGPQQPNLMALAKLAPGDCLQVPQQYAKSNSSRLYFWRYISWPTKMPVVPCGQLHSGEVFFADDLWSARQPFPGTDAMSLEANTHCVNAFTTYVGISPDKSSLNFTEKFPAEKGWAAGDRHVFCVAYDGAGNDLSKSIQRSAK